MNLPRSLDQLQGLRAARWVRESTTGQYDSFGPDAQREQQDRAIERWGLVDTGLVWQVAHSGRTVAATPQWAEMVAAAGTKYDVLVVGYVSRFARDLRTAVNARHELHLAGAAILFADERLLSSDEDPWEHWARDTVEAEAYSRRLSKRTSEGYAAKFRRFADQGGNAPLGFRRGTEPPHLLEVDPTTIRHAVALFEQYAGGTISIDDLGNQAGIAPDAVRAILANPVYNGWVRRHRRGHDEERLAARWRDDPPVGDALWAQVQEVRADRHTGGGGPQVRTNMLAKRLWCVCGRRLQADASTPSRGYVYRRYAHPQPCPAFAQRSYRADVYEDPIAAQVRGMRIDGRLRADLRALAGIRVPAATPIRRRQLERELTEKAAAHARRTLATDAYLAEHERITAAMDSLATDPGTPSVAPETAERYLRDLRRAWRWSEADIDGGEQARAQLVAALYQRVTVRDHWVVEVELTPEAVRHGASLAIPELVALARPEGVGPGVAANRIVIVGRRALKRLLRSA